MSMHLGSTLDSTMHTVFKKAVQVNNPLDKTERIMAVVCPCVTVLGLL